MFKRFGIIVIQINHNLVIKGSITQTARCVPYTCTHILLKQFGYASFSFQLYDRISSAAIVPARAPPGDAVLRCRDAVEAISALASGGGTLGTSRHSSKQHAQERGELLHLLSMPHIQVSL